MIPLASPKVASDGTITLAFCSRGSGIQQWWVGGRVGRSPKVPASILPQASQRFADVRVRVSVLAIRASINIPIGIRPGSEVETDELSTALEDTGRFLEVFDSFFLT